LGGKGGVGVGLLFLARRWVPRLAARLFEKDSMPQKSEGSAGRHLLEIALTLVALYCAANYIPRALHGIR
jgi:hypothetical protein